MRTSHQAEARPLRPRTLRDVQEFLRRHAAVLTGQWPLAVVLAGLLAVDYLRLQSGGPYGDSRAHLLLWALSWVTCAAALLAWRLPALATAVLAVTLATGGTYAHLHAVYVNTFINPLTVTDLGAWLIVLVAVVRHSPPLAMVAELAILAGVVAYAGVLRYRHGETALGFRVEAMLTASLFALAAGGGLSLRARDVQREHTFSTAVFEAQRETRLAVARELHDVVAHHVTGIVVQSNAALEVAGSDPSAAHRLLPGISRSGTEALAAMRRLADALRGPAQDPGATTDLRADLVATVERARANGLPVRASITLPAAVPQEVGRSALRLLQESLTNVQKHAVAPTLVDVDVCVSGAALRLAVTDDGRGPYRGPAAGSRTSSYGLAGMRERVELLDGRIAAGPREGGPGWQVRAEVPLGSGAR
jgi:signal transduction histidine kinase